MAADPLNSYARGSLILGSTLPANERLLLLVISAHGSSTGRCFPSRERLAADCGMSISTVDRAVRTLAAEPWSMIRKIRRREAVTGRQTSNRYIVDWSRLQLFQRPAEPVEVVEDHDGGEGLFDSQGVNLTAGQGVKLTGGQGVNLQPPGASTCSPRGRQPDALPINKDLVTNTHTAGGQLDARSLSDETDAARLPSLVVCADLITDFYTRLFGATFTPPNATPAEMTLASTIVRHCGDARRAKTLQATVVERIKRSFPACRRFLGAEAEWKLRLAANAKSRREDDVRNAERARRRQETSAAEQRKAQADHDETLPAWQALPPQERERFLARYPAAVAGREFFAVLDFASSLESSPCR